LEKFNHDINATNDMQSENIKKLKNEIYDYKNKLERNK
jgi:hypothetical protein